MKIAIASDHAGYAFKTRAVELLKSWGHEVLDFGTFSPAATDYPLWIIPAAQAVADGRAERAVVFGGSGNGEAIAANKVRGIRCALCWSVETAELSRRHNNANALSIGERVTDPALLAPILETWLTAPFDGGRHERRIRELAEFEATGKIQDL